MVAPRAQWSHPAQNYRVGMAGGAPNNFGLGRVGVWTFALDLQPMHKSQEAAQELEELGYGCIWVPEAVGREPFASCALLLSGTKRIGVATGIASMYARSAVTMQAGWRTLSEAFTKIAREVLGARPLLAPEQAVLLETDPGTARDVARKFMSTYTRLPNYANNLRRLGYTDDDIGDGKRPASDRMVDAIVAWGTIDDAVARVKAHFDAGASHVSIQVLDADPMALPMRQWRELAAATRHL